MQAILDEMEVSKDEHQRQEELPEEEEKSPTDRMFPDKNTYEIEEGKVETFLGDDLQHQPIIPTTNQFKPIDDSNFDPIQETYVTHNELDLALKRIRSEIRNEMAAIRTEMAAIRTEMAEME